MLPFFWQSDKGVDLDGLPFSFPSRPRVLLLVRSVVAVLVLGVLLLLPDNLMSIPRSDGRPYRI